MLKDYLNFFCSTCQKNLCKEHYHSSVSCPFKVDDQTNLPSNVTNIEAIKKSSLNCSYNICKEPIFNSAGYECRLCQAIFCLKHRIESDHQCPNMKVSFKNKYLENKNKFKERLAELKNKKWPKMWKNKGKCEKSKQLYT